MKWFFIALIGVGAFFLVNAYIPQAWASGYRVSVGHGIHVTWAATLLAAVIGFAIYKVKTK